jgi:hypothetical protein
MNINVIASDEDYLDIITFKGILRHYERFIVRNKKIIKDGINIIVGCKLFNKYGLNVDYFEGNVITIPNRKEEVSKFVKGLNLLKVEFNKLLLENVKYINLDVNVNSRYMLNEKISLCRDKTFIKFNFNTIDYYYGCGIIFGLNEDYLENTKNDYEILKAYLDRKVEVELNNNYDKTIDEFIKGIENNKKYIPYIYHLLYKENELVV